MTNNHFTHIHDEETCALVIGGGIAGLLAARVLSEHYDQVKVVERDILPAQAEHRAGTPQAVHLHRLLGRGQISMERLFPNITAELIEFGADPMQNKKIRIANSFGQFIVKATSEISCGRSLREWAIRQRVEALSNVDFSSGFEVIGLQTNSEQDRVTGVHIRKHGQTEQSETLKADLIIDASGHSTKLTQWLQVLDYEVPEPEHLQSNLGYSTRYYKVSPQYAKEWAGMLIQGQPSKKIKTAYALVLENNTLGVFLFGAGGDHPSTDVKQFEQQLRELTSSALTDFLQAEAEPTAPPQGYRVEECLRQHFDQMERWPFGLLVMGDALCNLDPIYGHGMTVAALEAEMLDTCLKEQKSNPHPDFERRTLQSLQTIIEPAWWIDALADLSWEEVTYLGQEPPKAVTLIHRYLDLYLQEATTRMEYYANILSNSDKAPFLELNPFATQPSMISYALVNELIISPNIIYNAKTYRLLLMLEEYQEGPHLLRELTNEYHLSLEEILDRILPHFELTFANSAGEFTEI